MLPVTFFSTGLKTAFAFMVLDRRPDLAPPVGRAERQQFQRLLVWLVANVYPTFTFADYPERWA